MTRQNEQLALKNTIVEAILEKKGGNVAVLNLTKLQQSIADYFIVCHAESSVQVDAIADFIEKQTKTALKQAPIHKEGKNNALWILLDYGDVVVHVFKEEQRYFYKIEELWADAQIEYINEE